MSLGPVYRNPLVDAMQDDLRAASPELVDNALFMQGVLSGCGDCIKILDLDGRLQFMSEGGRRVMEVDDFSALKGCPWPEFWTGEGNVQAVAAVKAARAGTTARFSGAANTAKGSPRYWDVQVSPILGPDGSPAHLLSISRDITEQWQADRRQQFLADELKHRVKNNLATVMAIAKQTFRGDAHREPRTRFDARLMAISHAYDLMNEANWTQASVRKVVETALIPQSSEKARFHISGPEVELGPRQSLAMALSVNELATNALKYGALSVPSGRVEISWQKGTGDEALPTFEFVWREVGGPVVSAPTQESFGTRVIKTMMADEFGGDVLLSFEPTGVVCSMRSRLEHQPS